MSRRKLLLACTLAVILAIPRIANSLTLNQLLDMPIERLLRLEITSRHLSQPAALWPPSAKEPPAVEHRDAP